FQGYGRTTVDDEGRYAFRTIRPVAYAGRSPHIHFKVQALGAGQLTTQMYVAGEPQNARDGVLRGIRNAKARESVIVPLLPASEIEPGAVKGTFDVVLDL
ncbi:MAG: protocatechuate 3,4-dioxygenase subunit beta, partial [Hyphomicrobiaceae bacterium]